jgi:hypothetical protein
VNEHSSKVKITAKVSRQTFYLFVLQMLELKKGSTPVDPSGDLCGAGGRNGHLFSPRWVVNISRNLRRFQGWVVEVKVIHLTDLSAYVGAALMIS